MPTNNTDDTNIPAPPPVPTKLNPVFLVLYIVGGFLAAVYAYKHFLPTIVGAKLFSYEGVFKFVIVFVSALNPILFFGLFIVYKIVSPLFDMCDSCMAKSATGTATTTGGV